LSTIALFFFPLIMAFAASSDLLTMRISNALVLLLAAGFFVLAGALGVSLETIAMHLLCGAVVLLVAFAFFALGWVGGGDAKLAAATALWLGFGVTLPYLVYAAMLGGALTLIMLSLRRIPLMPAIARFEWVERLHDKKSGVPYGIALAGAGLLSYPESLVYVQLAG
jgi:prepilin peptidase CpaA